jgi:hypothetical protein
MVKKQTRTTTPHPDDEALRALLDNQDADPETATHVADCAVCARRVMELRRGRRLLREAALREEPPRRDLAAGAMARLRVRHGMNTQLGEIVAELAAFLHNLLALFARPAGEVTPAAEKDRGGFDQSPSTDEGAS